MAEVFAPLCSADALGKGALATIVEPKLLRVGVTKRAVMKFDTTSEWGHWFPKGKEKTALDRISRLPVNPLCKRLAFLLRKPIKKGTQAFYDVTVWGHRLRLCAKGNLSEQRWLTMPSFHDTLEREVIAEKLAGGGVFFDVGANAGFYTFWVLSLRADGVEVVSVEPSHTMQERIEYNLQLNGLETSVTLLKSAVTQEPCEVLIEEHADNLGQTSVAESGSGYAVEGKPLLQLMDEQQVDQIDVLKIDIEGGECEVLKALFDSTKPSRWPKCIVGEIIGEASSRFRELLESRGYTLEQATKMNGVFTLTAST